MGKKKDALDEFIDGIEDADTGAAVPEPVAPPKEAPKKSPKKAKPAAKPIAPDLEDEIEGVLGGGCGPVCDITPLDAAEGQGAEETVPAEAELITSEAPNLPRLPKDSAQLGVAPQVVARTSGAQAATDPSALVAAMLQRTQAEFDSLSNSVLEKWEGDRAQLEETIQSFLTAMGDDPNNAARPIVEGLVSLLETKVNSGMLAVKLMDTKIKLLAALKGGAGVIINNQNIAAGGLNADLTEMLSNPPDDDLA